jgi:hypothetical protein
MAETSEVGVAIADEEPSVIFFFFMEASDLVFRVRLPFIKSFKVGASWPIKGLTETGAYLISCPLVLLVKDSASILWRKGDE